MDDRAVRAAAIYVPSGGTMQAGTPNLPYPKRARIQLLDFFDAAATAAYIDALLPASGPADAEKELRDALKANGLVVANGGNLFVYGKSYGASWDRLSATVGAGATSLSLASGTTAAWAVGQEFVVASTDYPSLPGFLDRTQSEVRTITSLTGPTLFFTTGLDYAHVSASENFDPAPPAGLDAWTVEERAEVGLLSRKIRFLGIENPAVSGHQGHVFFHRLPGAAAPRIEVTWAEFRGLGNAVTLSRYPVHFHMLGDVTPPAAPMFLQYCSVRDAVNNGIVIHGTAGVLVERNVIHNVVGYGIYLEEDVGGLPTVDNVLRENLALGNERPSGASNPNSPLTEHDPANFAIRNLRNVIEGNVAAESKGSGFYLKLDDDALPVSFDGMSFRANVAHSCGSIGIYQNAEMRPANLIEFADCFVWKCRQYGMWIRGLRTYRVSGLVAADCRSGFYPAALGVRGAGEGNQIVTDALFVGQTANAGNPDPLNAYEAQAQRSLPQNQPFDPPNRALRWDTLNGIEMYDGLIQVENSRFAQFQDLTFDLGPPAAPRLSAGLTQVAKFSTWGNDPRNRVKTLAFHPSSVTRRAYLRGVDPGQNQIAFTLIVDEDDSLGFGANVALLPNDPYLVAHRGLTPDAGLNGYVVPLASAGYGQVVLEVDDPIPPYPYDGEWDRTLWDRIADPAGARVAGPAWEADTTPTAPSAGGHGEYDFPVATEVGLAALPAWEVRYYRVRYPDLATLGPPLNFNFAFRFAPAAGTVVYLEFPYAGGSGPNGGPVQPSFQGTSGAGGSLQDAGSLVALVGQQSSAQAYFYDPAAGLLYIKCTALLQGGQPAIPFGTETIVTVKAQ